MEVRVGAVVDEILTSAGVGLVVDLTLIGFVGVTVLVVDVALTRAGVGVVVDATLAGVEGATLPRSSLDHNSEKLK